MQGNIKCHQIERERERERKEILILAFNKGGSGFVSSTR
jgi:hypothetical protein